MGKNCLRIIDQDGKVLKIIKPDVKFQVERWKQYFKNVGLEVIKDIKPIDGECSVIDDKKLLESK